MDQIMSATILALAIYCGMSTIASAIRTRTINVNLPPIRVRHINTDEEANHDQAHF